jgi:hypothetical protein
MTPATNMHIYAVLLLFVNKECNQIDLQIAFYLNCPLEQRSFTPISNEKDKTWIRLLELLLLIKSESMRAVDLILRHLSQGTTWKIRTIELVFYGTSHLALLAIIYQLLWATLERAFHVLDAKLRTSHNIDETMFVNFWLVKNISS